MKRISKYLYLIIVFVLGTPVVSASSTCSYEEQVKLNNTVVNVKANYEEQKEVVDPSTYTPPETTSEDELVNYVLYNEYLQVSFLNISDDIYLIVSNNVDKTKMTITSSMATDGVYKYNWKNLNKVATLTINIYASSKTNCADELYRTFYLTLPRINEYYNYDICTNNSEYYMCQKYVTFESLSSGDFFEKVSEYGKSKNKTSDDTNKSDNKFIEFIKNNKTYLIIGGIGILVVAGGIVTYTVIKRKRVLK